MKRQLRKTCFASRLEDEAIEARVMELRAHMDRVMAAASGARFPPFSWEDLQLFTLPAGQPQHVAGLGLSLLFQQNRLLTLCEVEVYGFLAPTGDNVALYGKAAQSSLHSLGVPNNAIDGNRNGIWKVGSCTHTELELNPWWRVDLLKTYKVFSVTITNTLDSIPSRLNGAEIHIGDSLKDNGINNPRCAVISSIPGGTSSTFQCNGMEGRYVIVVIPGRNEYLTLCEVEVFGSPLEGKSE